MMHQAHPTARESPREFAMVSGTLTGARAINRQLREILHHVRKERMRHYPEHAEVEPEIRVMAAAAVVAQTESLALIEQIKEQLFR